jgi:hypothetical protein
MSSLLQTVLKIVCSKCLLRFSFPLAGKILLNSVGDREEDYNIMNVDAMGEVKLAGRWSNQQFQLFQQMNCPGNTTKRPKDAIDPNDVADLEMRLKPHKSVISMPLNKKLRNADRREKRNVKLNSKPPNHRKKRLKRNHGETRKTLRKKKIRLLKRVGDEQLQLKKRLHLINPNPPVMLLEPKGRLSSLQSAQLKIVKPTVLKQVNKMCTNYSTLNKYRMIEHHFITITNRLFTEQTLHKYRSVNKKVATSKKLDLYYSNSSY